MMKVMLVDDEKNIIEMLKKIIDWKQIGYELSSEAYDGLEAVELVKSNVPDVIIADINMPNMDGLKFSEYIRETYGHIKVILLTGQSNFYHARKAVNIGVYYFLLKPIDKEELEELLARAKLQIEQERMDERSIEALKTKATVTDQLRKGQFVHDLVTSSQSLSNEDIKQKLIDFQIPLNGAVFHVIAIEIDRIHVLFHGEEEKQQSVKCLLDLVNEHLSNKHQYLVFRSNDSRIVIVNGGNSQDDPINSNLQQICNKIRSSAAEKLGYSVTVGFGSGYERYDNIFRSYHEAIGALRYKLIMGNNRNINYNSIEFSETSQYYCSDTKRNELLLNLRAGNYPNLCKIVDSIMEDVSTGNIYLEHARMLYLDLLLIGNSFIQDHGIQFQDVFSRAMDPIEELQSKETLQEIKEWTLDFYKKSMEYVLLHKTGGNKRAVQQTIKLIEKNISNADISVNALAKEMHMSEDYLSSLFKREFGIPLIKYLNNFRLEKAKELIDSGWRNVAGVAQKVGYEDYNYFGKCFKKHFGIAPSEYLKSKIEKTSV